MSRRDLTSGLAVALAALLAATRPANAQECARAVVDAMAPATLGPWNGFRPSDMQARFTEMTDAGVFSPVLDSLVRIYLGGTGALPSSAAGLTDDHLKLLRAELDSARAELVAGEVDRSVLLRGAVTVRRFDITFVVAASQYLIFVGRAPGPIRVDNLGTNEQRTICWLAMAVKDLLTKFGGPGRQALVTALDDRVTRWENFAQRGYSMFPHELLLNGFLPRPSLEPPPYQLIVAHPSVATQMTGESFESLEKFARTDVLGVEPLGIIIYGPKHGWYLGGSWLMTFPSTGESGAGNGLIVHLSKFGRAGYVWRHEASDGTSRNAWVLSLDIYGFLTKAAGCRQSLKGLAPAQFVTAAQQCLAPKK